MRRSDQRRDAVFALYQHEVTGRPLAGLLREAKPFTRDLAEAVEETVLSSVLRQPATRNERMYLPTLVPSGSKSA